PAPRWTVDDITESATLVASLGGRDGYPLGRVTDAVRLADGSVVFID
ncbi:MAG: hypothetical protein GWN71_04510, partial [Gammaproteobacteria bacterium]|nr:hypothetical protein [Gammaproteobacteria bacterium]